MERYLMNHLGSTMLVYGTQGIASTDAADLGGAKAAYDYRAFGEQVSMMEPAEKVTENFTGIRSARRGQRTNLFVHCRAAGPWRVAQGQDDEIELNYFGARYLDPMLGLWISVDPARQYQNPFIYAGNNPVMRIDPNGLWGFDVNIGARGAVIVGGTVSLRLSYDSEDPSKNKVLFTAGYGVGMEIGLPVKSGLAKAASKVSVNSPGETESAETGWHSEIDIGLGVANASFADGNTTPSSIGTLSVGGGYYETYTIDIGKFFNDKMEDAINTDYSDNNAD